MVNTQNKRAIPRQTPVRSCAIAQVPDVFEDFWIEVALGEIERAKQTIDAVPEQHRFELRYQQIEKVEWESCSRVLDANERKRCLLNGW